jgi:hypothetical protein
MRRNRYIEIAADSEFAVREESWVRENMSDIEPTKRDKAFVKSWSLKIPSKVRTKLSATHSPFVFEEN